MMPDSTMPAKQAATSVHGTFLRLALGPYTVHFKNPNYVKESTLDRLDKRVCRKVLEKAREDKATRDSLGCEAAIWLDLTELLKVALASLQKRTFAPFELTNANPEDNAADSFSTLYEGLMKDLTRLKHVICIGRTILSAGEKAQNLAVEAMVDHEVFRLINLSVKVTARGYDGTTSRSESQKWQTVVDAYKKLIMISLQFVNNLIVQNERNKLVVWIELFDTAGDMKLSRGARPRDTSPGLWSRFNKLLSECQDISKKDGASSEENNGTTNEPKVHDAGEGLMDDATFKKIKDECEVRLKGMSEGERAICLALLTEIGQEEARILKTLKEADGIASKLPQALDLPSAMNVSLQSQIRSLLDSLDSNDSQRPLHRVLQEFSAGSSQSTRRRLASLSLSEESGEDVIASLDDNDFKMRVTAHDGYMELQNGKDSLVKHMGYPDELIQSITATENARRSHLGSDLDKDKLTGADNETDESEDDDITEDDEDLLNEDEDEDEDEDDENDLDAGNEDEDEDDDADGDEDEEGDENEDDDFIMPGDDGRGLLTDIPLILGPSEIEPLAMILLAGIKSPQPQPESTDGSLTGKDGAAVLTKMHSVRCHMFLAQDHGRNLLRELLIFIAAWDLREEDIFFKLMTKIIEALFSQGLLSFLYHSYREPKDIVSPAQNTILKILTTIFRDRQSKAILTDEKGRKLPIEKSISSYPLKYDVKLVNYLLTQFRQCITPQTCSLIFLQGQIAIGRAQPQDFPLSLWDMERMYDGVYQYLEFFAILTENDVWKKMMADWQMTSELITLLRELDTAIPKRQRRPNPIKAPGQPPGQPPTDAKATKKQPGVATSVTDQAGRPPVAVERPYEVNSERQPGSSAAPTEERDSAVESSAQADELHGEAAGFEWKNLKKLAILVLSSLIYKSRKVQDQVRTMAGVEVILACCNYDEHNPYIREHAIMCLRFLIEGNKENQDIIRTLEARRVVPSEVLDQRGYETFMDSRGQVGLRRKIAARTQAKK